MPSPFRRWIRSLSRPAPADRRLARPSLVELESRDTPAVYTVDTTADAGPGSLRQAILDANTITPGITDTILFQIPGAPLSVRTIAPTSALPAVTDPLTIDGWSQGVFDGAPGYNAAPLVELSGAAAGAGVDGLTFQVTGTLNGLVVNRFGGNGVVLTNVAIGASGNSRVFGNYIGTTADGLAAASNGGNGILITTAAGSNLDNVIGTDADGVNDTAERNVISGNAGTGVQIAVGNATGTHSFVRGNYIGTDAAGAAAVPNAVGIRLQSNGSTVGIAGTEAVPANAGNVISGNTAFGILVTADGAVIAGNVVGLNAAATAPVGNGTGVDLFGRFGPIRLGTDADGTNDALEANTISGNLGTGVLFDNGNNHLVAGNFIGTTAAGTAFGNGGDGVWLRAVGGQVVNNVVGGAAAAARNVIRFNTGAGVRLSGDVVSGNTVLNNVIGDNGSGVRVDAAADVTANAITGNFIGTDPTATQALGNTVGVLITSDGNSLAGPALLAPGVNTIAANGTLLRVDGSNNVLSGLRLGTDAAGTAAAFTGALRNTVGLVLAGSGNALDGTAAGGPSVVGGNSGDGIQLIGSGAVVSGNRIGTTLAGTAAVPNGGHGVAVTGVGNTVGGTAAGAGNVISGNGGSGVEIRGSFTFNNAVWGNTIGLTADGTTALGNGGDGVTVYAGAFSNPIGGGAAGAGNVISGNGGAGVRLGGPGGGQPAGTQNDIAANVIGLDAAGTAAVPNAGAGVLITSGTAGTALVLNTVSGNGGAGIALAGATGTSLGGNVVGLAVAGTTAVPNLGGGIALTLNSTNTTIGGFGVMPANTISGNTGPGVLLDGPGVTGNVVQSNFIGTTANTTAVVPNTGDGVVVRNGAADTTVDGNVVSGNAGAGLRIGGGATGTVVVNNAIGTDVFGSGSGFGNGGDGVVIDAANNNTIGGVGTGRNVISGNALNGVLIANGSSGNTVRGNYIGTTGGGSAALPNGTTGVPFVGDGVRIDGANNNTVGGTAAGSGNVLSGNVSDGVDLRNGATGNVVVGNLIGTDAAGTAPLGNQEDGVYFEGAAGNSVGGATAAERNVIAANGSNGVFFYGPGSDNNVVAGNFIGTDVTGLNALGNTLEGVFIWQDPGSGNLAGPTGNLIGGTASGAGNVIAFNGQTGIKVGLDPADASTGNRFLGNSIHSNAGIGIDLGGDGPTANDPLDADAGANDLQNHPVITSVLTLGGATTVQGTLGSTPNKTFRVEVFSNLPGESQGRTYLGFLDVTTDAAGQASFTFTTAAVAAGTPVTATATDGTSEFSAAVAAVSQVGTTTTVSAPTVVYGTLPTVTVTVAPTSGAGTPVGTVAVSLNGAPVGSGTLDATGQFTFQLPTAPGAGSYTLTADYTPTDPAFLASSGTAPLTVTPAPLTVTADSVTRYFGRPNPSFTASFAGLVNGDTPTALGGTLAFATLATPASPPGAYPVTPSGLTSPNYDITFVPGTLTVTAVVERVAVGAGPGGGPRVQVLDAAGAKLMDFFAFDAGLRGGVSVATADVTGDGTEDVIAGAGDGGGTHVKVFDGVTGAPVASWFAYGTSFRGGVWVAAGDLDGDGSAEIVTGPGKGGGPVVKAWRLADGVPTEQFAFLAFDESFRGGTTVACGRDDSGRAVIVAGAGVGGEPRVRTFDGRSHALLTDLLAFDASFTGGVYVAAGDVLGTGLGTQVVVGPGPGGGPRFRVFGPGGADLGNGFAAVDSLRNGLTVAVLARPAGPAAVLVGAGVGAFQGVLAGGVLTDLERVGFFGDGFDGGVFVG